jgi:hypothetical protein
MLVFYLKEIWMLLDVDAVERVSEVGAWKWGNRATTVGRRG